MIDVLTTLVAMMATTVIAYMVGHADGRDAEAADIVAFIEDRTE